ncbi:MAG: hypothetical protein U0797_06280 [Gemmataceae bacterium]
MVSSVKVKVDTGADYVVLDWNVAVSLGLSSATFGRQAASGAAGHAFPLLFAAPGQIALFVTDFREYCYLPRPLVGFHSPSTPQQAQRSVVGLTGFLEYFRFILNQATYPPTFELSPIPGQGVQAGILPRDRPLTDFIQQLRAAP